MGTDCHGDGKHLLKLKKGRFFLNHLSRYYCHSLTKAYKITLSPGHISASFFLRPIASTVTSWYDYLYETYNYHI